MEGRKRGLAVTMTFVRMVMIVLGFFLVFLMKKFFEFAIFALDVNGVTVVFRSAGRGTMGYVKSTVLRIGDEIGGLKREMRGAAAFV